MRLPRHLLPDVLLALLALTTIVLASRALRPVEPARLVPPAGSPPVSPSPAASPAARPVVSPSVPAASPSPAPVTRALLAVAGPGAFVRVVAGEGCRGDSLVATSSDGGVTWAASTVPLRGITALAAGGGRAVALGRDESCAVALAASDDAGATWRLVGRVDATAVAIAGTDVWLLRPRAGAASRLTVSGFGLEIRRTVTDPCRARNDPGPAAAVTGAGRAVVVTCLPRDVARPRLRVLYRSDDGGRSWRSVAGARSLRPSGRPDGLDAAGEFAGVRFGTSSHGVALVHATACADAELRLTTDGGSAWRAVACPPAGVVGDIAWDGRTMLAVVRAASGWVTWRSAGGAGSWLKAGETG